MGNIANGSFIALNREGEQLINLIQEGGDVDSTALSENLKEMIEAALDCKILLRDKLKEHSNKRQISAAYLHITNKCNLHCVGCYSFDYKRNRAEDLPLEAIKDILKKLKEGGVEKLFISGGEPTLRNDLVEILKYAKETLGIKHIAMASNGSNFTMKIAEEVGPYIDTLNISVDGYYDDEKYRIRDAGSFEIALNAIRTAKNRIGKVVMLPTITKNNYMYIPQYGKLAEEYGVSLAFSLMTCDTTQDKFSNYVVDEECLKKIIRYMNNTDFQLEDVPANIDHISFKSSCGAGKGMISVDSNGDVYPCHMLHVDELKMGNLLKQSLNQIIAMKELNVISNYSVETTGECAGCRYQFICGGGCRARSYYANKGLHGKDNLCNGYKEIFKNVESFFASLE